LRDAEDVRDAISIQVYDAADTTPASAVGEFPQELDVPGVEGRIEADLALVALSDGFKRNQAQLTPDISAVADAVTIDIAHVFIDGAVEVVVFSITLLVLALHRAVFRARAPR
jgi:hypothetical protein